MTNKLSVKISLISVVCLTLIFVLFSWILVEHRKQALQEELFAKGQMAAIVGAKTCSRILEDLVSEGQFTREEVFDDDYRLISEGPLAGSKIPKYHTIYDRVLDQKIQVIEDAFLMDAMVVYAVLVDRNGYLPTHNSRYSQPLTGDPLLDRVGSRTKRIFDDPVGIAAARFAGEGGQTVLKQVYPRDTGVLMWDLSAPVFVHGEHWGVFRIGFSMEATDARLAGLQRTIWAGSVAAMLSCAFLIMFLVNKAVRPLRALTFAVQAIASGQRRERISIQSNDEVGLLVDAFNRMEDSLEQTTVSRDFFDMLLQSMHDLLIVTDADGQIVSVNQATCAVLDYNREHVVTHKIQEIVSLRGQAGDWFSQQLKARQNYTADVFLVNCKGDKFPMAMSCSPLHERELEITGFIFTFQDNSERLRAEHEKEEAHQKTLELNTLLRSINVEMESKNEELAGAYKQLKNSQVQILQQEKMASIGQLAAGVAHEINNPMGFISSNLSTLKKYVERLGAFIEKQSSLMATKMSSDDLAEVNAERKSLKIDYLMEDSQDLVDESLDGAKRVKVIVQNLKSFSRVDQEDEHPANINECLENTIAIAWNELKYKVTLEKDFGELPEIVCYPQKLNQVFLNLLVNASQAIENNGTIKVRTWRDQENISVSVGDDGCGIPEESMSRIFEPFFTTKEVGKGTGLGMSISYDIIKEHGGEIHVESEVGKGTVFRITLPLRNDG